MAAGQDVSALACLHAVPDYSVPGFATLGVIASTVIGGLVVAPPVLAALAPDALWLPSQASARFLWSGQASARTAECALVLVAWLAGGITLATARFGWSDA